MNTRSFLPTVVAASALIFAVSPALGQTSEWQEATRLAGKIQDHAEFARTDIRSDFRTSPVYSRLMSQVQRIDDGVKQIHRLPPQSHGSAARLQQVTAGIEASIKELDQTLKQATPKRAPNFFQAGSRRVQRQVANMNRNVHALKSVAGLLVRKEQEQRQRELALQRQRELEAQQRRHRQSWGRQQPHGPHGHGSHGSGSHGHGAHGHGSNGSHGSHGSHGHGSPQQPSSGQWSPFSQQPEPSRSSTGHSSHRYTPARPVPSTREQPGATPGQFLQGFFGNFR